MNIVNIILLFVSAAFLNAIVFYIFKKYLIKKENPAMKFLMANIIKDIIWVGFWLLNLENTTSNFLAVIAAFLVTAIFLYYKVIQILNRS